MSKSSKVSYALPALSEEARILFKKGDDVHRIDEYAIRYWKIEDDIRYLSGQILTIIDASIVDKEQSVAIKSLIKDRVSDTLCIYQDLSFKL
jgi:hypothetical protein